MYSTMYTSGVDGMREAFQSSETVVLLGLTTNLFGLAIGGVILSSLSEIFGRRPVYIFSVLLFGVFVLPVALAKNTEAILISRFFNGFFGGVMISSGPGSVADVTDDEYRALALSCWSLGAMNGPVLGMPRPMLATRPSDDSFSYPGHRSYCWRLYLPVSWLALD